MTAKRQTDDRPVLHAPPPPSPAEIERETERRRRETRDREPERGTEWVDFYV